MSRNSHAWESLFTIPEQAVIIQYLYFVHNKSTTIILHNTLHTIQRCCSMTICNGDAGVDLFGIY